MPTKQELILKARSLGVLQGGMEKALLKRIINKVEIERSESHLTFPQPTPVSVNVMVFKKMEVDKYEEGWDLKDLCQQGLKGEIENGSLR